MPNNTSVELTAILPKGDVINIKAMMGVIKGGSVEIAKKVRVDLQKTTRTWKHRVVFVIKIGVGNDESQVTVYTDDDIYNYVSGGTKPHWIKPRRAKALRFGVPFKAKTRVGFIGSSNGKRGDTLVFSKGVYHPGSEARDFDKVIADKWQPVYVELMQRRIDNAVDARS